MLMTFIFTARRKASFASAVLCYSKSIRLSVRPSHSGIVPK